MDLLLESRIDYLVKFGGAIKKNDWYWLYSGKFEDLLRDRVAVILPRSGLRLHVGVPPYINLKESDDSFGICHSGIALKKGFCFRERLNDTLNGIINVGLDEKWMNDYAFVHTIRNRNEKISNHGSIPIPIDCNVVAIIVFEEVWTNDSTSP
ncbi:hypothetical protein TNCV_4931511 [Trichonephila clavipes]|nr:hypothetical protein TNCV_4931511 [Trichonephila clavipes]